MSGSGENQRQNIKQEPGLPLENIKHCKMGGICWFNRFDGQTWHRDLGVIIEVDKNVGVVVIQSLTTLASLPESYNKFTGRYDRIPKPPFGCPVKANLDSVRAHLQKLNESGQQPEMRDVHPQTHKIIGRAMR